MDSAHIENMTFVYYDSNGTSIKVPEFLFKNWSYDDTPYSHFVVTGTIMAVLCILGMVGNGIAICIFMSHLKHEGELVLLNLAIGDFLVSAVAFPIMTFYSFKGIPIDNYWACNLDAMLNGSIGIVCIWSLALISLERLRGIRKPFIIGNANSKKYLLIAISLIWLHAIFWCCVLPFTGFSKFVLDGIGTSCTFNYRSQHQYDKIYVLGLFIFGFTIPFITATICYLAILIIVQKSSNGLYMKEDEADLQSFITKARKSADVKIAKLTCIILSGFCLAWLPYSVIAIMGMSGIDGYINPYCSLITVIFAKASAVYNPFIYVFTKQEIRETVLNFQCLNNDYRKQNHRRRSTFCATSGRLSLTSPGRLSLTSN